MDELDSGESAPGGHGGNVAAAFTGANRIALARAMLQSSEQFQSVTREKSIARRNR